MKDSNLQNKPMTFWSAVSLGIGSMIGAGIFALLGEAGAIAGNAVFISFLFGGIIALFSGYSLGKLGARYPSAGGIIEYLVQAFGGGILTGTVSIALYFAATISLALVAKTFGNYAAALYTPFGDLSAPIFSAIMITTFVLINLRGAKDVAFWEKITVAIKFSILAVFTLVGLYTLDPALLSPSSYPPSSHIFYSLAITFFAYEGFRVITNTAEDMPDPARTLPRAIMTSIVLVMLLYIGVSFAVFGNLPSSDVIAAKEYALAEAAKPTFGHVGFTIIALTALVSTASSVNANLYAVTNVTYRLAVEGILPKVFGKPIAHSREGLLISGALILVMCLAFNLSEIAAVGSISVLFVHALAHLGHIKLRKETGAHFIFILIAMILCIGAMMLALIYLAQHHANTLYLLIGFISISFIMEIILRKLGQARPQRQ